MGDQQEIDEIAIRRLERFEKGGFLKLSNAPYLDLVNFLLISHRFSSPFKHSAR